LADLLPPPESLLAETALSENLIGRNPDQKYPYCSFDLADIQAIKQANNLSL